MSAGSLTLGNRKVFPLPPPAALIAAIQNLAADSILDHDVERWAWRIAFASMMEFADLPRAKQVGTKVATKELERFIKLAKSWKELRDHILSMHLESIAGLIEFGGRATFPFVLTDKLAKFEMEIGADLETLSKAAESAMAKMDRAPRPAPKKTRQEGPMHVAREAGRAFEAIAGVRPTLVVDQKTNIAQGSFLPFLTDVFAVLGLNRAPAHYARLVCEERWAKETGIAPFGDPVQSD